MHKVTLELVCPCHDRINGFLPMNEQSCHVSWTCDCYAAIGAGESRLFFLRLGIWETLIFQDLLLFSISSSKKSSCGSVLFENRNGNRKGKDFSLHLLSAELR